MNAPSIRTPYNRVEDLVQNGSSYTKLVDPYNKKSHSNLDWLK